MIGLESSTTRLSQYSFPCNIVEVVSMNRHFDIEGLSKLLLCRSIQHTDLKVMSAGTLEKVKDIRVRSPTRVGVTSGIQLTKTTDEN